MTKYYIGANLASLDCQDLKPGYRIFQIIGNFQYESPVLDGPYDSIAQLKKESYIFKEALRKDSRRVQKILRPDRIVKIKDFAITDRNNSKPPDFLKTIEHIVKGDFRSKSLSGIHFYEEKRMTLIQITGSEDANKVWKAIVEVKDPNSDRMYRKETNFFPIEWDLTRLFHECEVAFAHCVRNNRKEFVCESYTESGIPVELIIKNNELISIYPIYGGKQNIIAK
jgi:hypothetical protein